MYYDHMWLCFVVIGKGWRGGAWLTFLVGCLAVLASLCTCLLAGLLGVWRRTGHVGVDA